jgi:RNA polymerase sigma-70 factor (ECF subfamily)
MIELTNDQIETCLKQIAQGNNNGLNPIYRHYQTAVFVYARHLILDDGLAEDIVQETFETLIKKPKKFDANGTAAFSTWLCAIAKYKTLRFLAKNRKHSKPYSEFNSEIIELNDENEEFEPLVLDYQNDEINELLGGCRDKLEINHRETIFWTYYMELHQKDVGKILSVAEGTIKSRLHYAIEKMRKCMTQFGLHWRE